MRPVSPDFSKEIGRSRSPSSKKRVPPGNYQQQTVDSQDTLLKLDALRLPKRSLGEDSLKALSPTSKLGHLKSPGKPEGGLGFLPAFPHNQ